MLCSVTDDSSFDVAASHLSVDFASAAFASLPASGPREASVRTTNKFLLQKDTGSFSYDCSPLMNFVWLTVSSARDSKPLGCMSQRRHRRVQKEIDIGFFRYIK